MLLSVIVPVHDVEPFVEECLLSILTGLPHPGVEVIAVDDASSDRSGEVLQRLAATHPSLTSVSLPDNVGQAQARNVGIERSRGEYLWFVDGDDMIPSGSVGAVLDALDATRPDVLVVDFERFDVDGSTEPRDGFPHEAGAPDLAVVRPELRSRTFLVQPYVWNKVIRRDLLDRHGLRFEGRWYEDQRIVAQVLLTARQIAVLRRCCYRYRLRPGSATRSTSLRHLESLEQWQGVFDFFRERPELERHRGDLVGRMVRALMNVLDDPVRLPADQKPAYFRAMSAMYRTNRGRAGQRTRATSLLHRTALSLGSYQLLLVGRRIGGGVRRLRNRG